VRDRYLILTIDSQLVPSTLHYIGHGHTPHDLRVRLTPWRESATEYSSRRHAIAEARRFATAGAWSQREWRVISRQTRALIWTNRSA